MSRTARTVRTAGLAAVLLAAAAIGDGAAWAQSTGRGAEWTQSTGRGAEWAPSTGRGAVVAVLDSGVQLDHPALRDHLWTSAGEIAGNGRDDDANGYVDDVHGFDVLEPGTAPDDDLGHGTHVAGILADVAPGARILPVRVLDGSGEGAWHAVAAGLRYAVAAGADVVNLSLNSDGSTAELERAVAEATAAGVTVVAAAGNDGRDIDERPSFPVALPDPAVLGVTALQDDGSLWWRGNRGRHAVDLAAPGTSVRAAWRGDGYEERSGTSCAAPQVAGALALLRSARPDLPAAALRSALLQTARAEGLQGLVGAGRLDVDAAMRAVAARVRIRIAPPRRTGSGRVRLRWHARGGAAVARWTVALDGRVVARRRAGVTRAALRVGSGRHRVRVVALDASGRPLAAASARLRAAPRRG